MQQSGLSDVFASWWRKLAVDESPDEQRKRLVQEHIADIKQGIALSEAMRLWYIEQRAHSGGN